MTRPRFFVFGDLVRIPVTGRHRARFLHAMTTAEVQKLAPGEATFALVATSNGRHVGQMRLGIEADAIQLVTRATAVEAILETLKKHKVADDVRFGAPVLDEATLAIYGDASGLEDLLTNARATAWDADRSELGVTTLEVRGTPEMVTALAQSLAARGLEQLDEAAWQAARIANGWPQDGVDLGPEDSALVSERLVATVCWTKGCFLGQEVFVMARDRGAPPKKLCRLELTHGSWPAPGSPVTTAEGAQVGVLGGAAGGSALAVLKKKAAEPGTSVHLADGTLAVVFAAVSAAVVDGHSPLLHAVPEPA